MSVAFAYSRFMQICLSPTCTAWGVAICTCSRSRTCDYMVIWLFCGRHRSEYGETNARRAPWEEGEASGSSLDSAFRNAKQRPTRHIETTCRM